MSSGGWYRASRDSWRLRRTCAAMKNDVLNQGYDSLDAPLADGTTHTLHDRLADHSHEHREKKEEALKEWASRIEWVQAYISQMNHPLHAAIFEGRLLSPLLRQRRRTIESIAQQYGKNHQAHLQDIRKAPGMDATGIRSTARRQP
jgi:hypothetical protein